MSLKQRKLVRDLAIRLRKLRNDKHLSTNQVSAKLGIQPHAVRRWERGETKPTIDHIAELSRLYEVSVEQIFFWEESEKHFVTVDVKPGQTIQIEVNAAMEDLPIVNYRPPIKIENDSKKKQPVARKRKRKQRKI